MAFKYHLVLSAHQVGVDQRQTTSQNSLPHHSFALHAFAHMKGRCVDHHQHFCTRLLGLESRFVKPSVFANQQTHPGALAILFVANLKNARFLTGHKVAAFVKHLIVGQMLFCIKRHHTPLGHHTGRIHQTGGAY